MVRGCPPGLRCLPVRVRGELSNREARRIAIAAQGLASPRPNVNRGRPGAKQLRQLMSQLGTIQLDAVNIVERTQFLVAFSRLGSYDPAALRALSGPGGQWFEYWGHAASLLPIELQPLFRWRMERSRLDLLDNVGARGVVGPGAPTTPPTWRLSWRR